MEHPPTHTRKYTGERPKGTGKSIGCEGAMEEHNRRTLAAIQNDRFVAALQKVRQEELRTALLIEAEMHKVPNSEELAALSEHERRLERVKAGAPIREVVPINRRLEPDYSLTGGASRWMAS